LEYYENQGNAVVNLDWERVSEGGAVVPDAIVIDEADDAFVSGGAVGSWQVTAGGYNGRMIWTSNHAVMRPDHNWARWTPDLAAGTYEVFAYVPIRENATSNAIYWISHRDGVDLQTVNQAVRGGTWTSLGTYAFTGTETDYVALFDVTSEVPAARVVLFDAMRWESR
jgi:hypothetical protein